MEFINKQKPKSKIMGCMPICFIIIGVYIFSSGFFSPVIKYNNRGNDKIGQKQYAGAEIEYRQAENVDPNSPETQYHIGKSLSEQGKLQEAVQAYMRVLQRGNDQVKMKTNYNLGNLMVKAGKHEEAVNFYKQALRLEHTHQPSKHNLELLLREMKEGNKKQEKSKPDQNNDQQKQQQDQKPQSSPQQDVSREEAMRLLDAVDKKEQDKKQERIAIMDNKKQKVDKDW